MVPDDLVQADPRAAFPLFEPWTGRLPPKASTLVCEPCSVRFARSLNREWHSRLPKTQTGPWLYAFHAAYEGRSYAVALWHNPSARMLPHHWVELRRMAVAPDAPHCTASWFLAAMVKWLRRNHGEHERAISYQDEAVHRGTIYKAAGWRIGAVQAYRQRDRSTTRPGGRMYRSSINGAAADAAPKIRWEMPL